MSHGRAAAQLEAMRWLMISTLSLLLWAGPARAQDGFDARSDAALAEGDLDAALRWARLARGDDPERGLERLARVHEARGEHVAALRLYLRGAERARGVRRARLRAGFVRCRARVGLVRVDAPLDASVTVDGAPAEWDRAGRLLPLAAGTRELRAQRPGSYVRVRSLTVEGGSTQSVTLVLAEGRADEERRGGGPRRFEAELGLWRDANLALFVGGAASASGFAVYAAHAGPIERRWAHVHVGLSLGMALGGAAHLGVGAAFTLGRERPSLWLSLGSLAVLSAATLSSGVVSGPVGASVSAAFGGAAIATMSNLFWSWDRRGAAFGLATASFLLAATEAMVAFGEYGSAGALTGDERFVAHAMANAEPCAAPPDEVIAQLCADAESHRTLGAVSAISAAALFVDAVATLVVAFTGGSRSRSYALEVGPGRLGLRGQF